MKCPLIGGERCNKNIVPNPKLFFFGFPYRDSFEDVEITVTGTMKEIGLNPYVAKDEGFAKHILCKVCKKMQESNFGIFELSEKSPNVMYELGMMGGMGKDFVIIARKGENIPSDLGGIEYIEYKSCQELRRRLLVMSGVFKEMMVHASKDKQINSIVIEQKDKIIPSSTKLSVKPPLPDQSPADIDPSVLPSSTHRIKTSCGHLFITVTKNGNKFYSVHTNMGKAGGCASSSTEAMSQLITVALKYNTPINEIIKKLGSISCHLPSWSGDGGKTLSCADAVSKVLKKEYDNDSR